MRVEPLADGRLPQLGALVNRHVGAVGPGWALSADALTRHLARDGTEAVTGPWVVARETRSAVDGDRRLRPGGAGRIVRSVAAADEAAGAGRVYRRFGWDALTRSARVWRSAR